MRGILAVEDFIKLAAGLMAGLFVLAIVWIYVMDIVSTDCWKDAIGPFNENLLGTKSLQTPLGTKESFIVPLNLDKTCVQAVYFISGEFRCSKACEMGMSTDFWGLWKHKFGSGIVEDCKSDCSKYCSSKECILLIPLPSDISKGLLDLNKPRVYGSGESSFQWGTAWSWSTAHDVSIKPADGYKCLIFSRLGDSKTYEVKPSNNTGECS